MDRTAQVGFDYLITYCWIMVLIAAIAGVLLFFLSSTGLTIVVVSSDPQSFFPKTSLVDSQTLIILLQNATGESIRVQGISSSGDYQNCTINGRLNPKISAGTSMALECIILNEAQAGEISIAYSGEDGVKKSVVLFVNPFEGNGRKPAGLCGNAILDEGELCDGPEGLSDPQRMECGLNCDKIMVTGCTVLRKSGEYILDTIVSPAPESIGPGSYSCIYITVPGVSFTATDSGSIDLGWADQATGIHIGAGNVLVQNIIVTGTGIEQTGIVVNAPGQPAITLQDNDMLGVSSAGGCGLFLFSSNMVKSENWCGSCGPKEEDCSAVCLEKILASCPVPVIPEGTA